MKINIDILKITLIKHLLKHYQLTSLIMTIRKLKIVLHSTNVIKVPVAPVGQLLQL